MVLQRWCEPAPEKDCQTAAASLSSGPMTRSDPGALVKALTPTCRTALESGVARCVAARNYEITLEHFLLGLIADLGSDFSRLVALHGFEPGVAASARLL